MTRSNAPRLQTSIVRPTGDSRLDLLHELRRRIERLKIERGLPSRGEEMVH